MTSEELNHLVNGSEGEHVEFKPSLLGRRELAEYAVGLGNSGGGWLLTGVSDRKPRRVLSFPWPSDEELQRMRTSIYDAARIRVDFERIEHPDGPVLGMRVPSRPRGMVFHTPDRIELSNPGAFPTDITPDNILHHPSTPRYQTLFGALSRIRLANAANLGVPRAFRDLLSEGKEPPVYSTTGQSIAVSIQGQEASPAFVALVRRHPDLNVDDLLVLHYLTRHREISTAEAARICQRPLDRARELLARLANRDRLLEPGGTAGRGRYHRLSRQAYEELGNTLAYHLDSRLSRENAKGRVLDALQHGPLSNAQIREVTQMSRRQVTMLMQALREGRLVKKDGERRGTRWLLGS